MLIKTIRNTFRQLGTGNDGVEASVLILHNFTALAPQVTRTGHSAF
jgi:hypothetical protein